MNSIIYISGSDDFFGQPKDRDWQDIFLENRQKLTSTVLIKQASFYVSFIISWIKMDTDKSSIIICICS